MRDTAREYKVVTQMGNQGTRPPGCARAVEVDPGRRYRPVSEAHVWTNRPIWPQAPYRSRPDREDATRCRARWPGTCGWAGSRTAFVKATYHPSNGAAGGTSAPARWATWPATRPIWRSVALNLGHPTSIAAEYGPINPETYPAWAKLPSVPARGDMPPSSSSGTRARTRTTSAAIPELVKGEGKRDGASIYFKDGKWWFRK